MKNKIINNGQSGLLHIIAIVAGALIIGALLISKVADSAKPGDSFYQLDQGFEKLQMLITIGNDDKALEYAKQASEREDEIIALIDEGADQALIDQAIDSFLGSQSQVLKMVESLPEETRSRMVNEVGQTLATQNQEIADVIGQIDTTQKTELLNALNQSKNNFNQLTKDLSATDLKNLEQKAQTQIRNVNDLLKKAGL